MRHFLLACRHRFRVLHGEPVALPPVAVGGDGGLGHPVSGVAEQPDGQEAEHGKGHGGSIGGGGPAARRNGMPDRGSIPLPRCEFVVAYVERHPEYRDLLA